MDSASYKKAVRLSNSVHTRLTQVVFSDMDGLLKGLQWGAMLQELDKLFVDSRFDIVPSLFSIGVPALVEREVVSLRSAFEAYRGGIIRETESVLDDKLVVITTLSINKLRDEMHSYTSDDSVVQIFEDNMASVVSSIYSKTREVVRANADKRLAKATYVFNQVLDWKSVTYERFLYHVLRTRSEMNPGSQLETWVRLEAQVIVSQHAPRYISTELFEEYTGDSAAFIEVIDKEFSTDAGVYDEFDRYFSRMVHSVQSILTSQYSRVYGLRIEAIDADALLEDDQKRALKLYAREKRKESESSRVVVSSSIDEIVSLYESYGARLLGELRVFILAAFLEYEAVSLRARAEGKQTCIVQFYEMRSALDDAFFFEYSKDRSFDLGLTRSDFQAGFDRALAAAPDSMFSLARTGYIHYMYDSARTFLLSRANLFFRDDVLILASLKPLLSSLHDDYATIIPLQIKKGVDDEVASEIEIAKLSVASKLSSFVTKMEFSFVTDMINGVKSSIMGDVLAKVDEIFEVFGSFAVTFIREALDPFDFAWFQSQADQFVTEDKIRYIDMKEHVINETNEYATAILEAKRSMLSGQVETLFSKVRDFMGDVATDLSSVVGGTSLQDEASRGLLLSNLESTVATMRSFSDTMQMSVMTTMEATLGEALLELDEVQRVRLKNFFNTKIQLIKDQFTSTVTSKVIAVYEEHMERVEDKMLGISTRGREVLRQHIDELLDLERTHRLEVEVIAKPVLEAEAEKILADYNIASFSARQSTLIVGMKNTVSAAAADVAAKRSLAAMRFARKWSDARSSFREEFMTIADESKADFIRALLVVTQYAKGLAADVMGHVDGVIDALERDLFHAMETAYSGVIDTVIGTVDNDLPKTLELSSIVFAPGVAGLTESPVLPDVAFLKDKEEEGPETTYGEKGEVLPSVDEPSGLNTQEIVMALMPWDAWLIGKIGEIVQAVVVSMEDGLKQNTCRNNKPPCREGWVQFTNSWGVECCRFDPASQGIPVWRVTRMVAFEIVLALALDIGNLISVGGSVVKKVGGTKLGARGVLKGKKAMAKTFQKFSGKSAKSMTNGIKLAGKVGGKSMTKTAGKTGAKIGVKVGVKVGTKGASMGAKVMAKMGLGPLGMALFIFDMVSLILDLWDPAGYNDAQTNGEIRAERDILEKNYHDGLQNEGFESPLLADPMFNLSPERQADVFSEAVMVWFEGEVSTFMTANESSFEAMPDSEIEASISEEYSRLALLLDEDPNLVTILVAAKMENVFLQDINVRENHRNPFTDGGKDSSRSHTRKNLAKSGIVEAVLNETGVRAFNSFQVKKSAFLNSFKYNPMCRFVKREHDYIVTKDVAFDAGYLSTGAPSTFVPPPVHTPTVAGSITYGNHLISGVGVPNYIRSNRELEVGLGLEIVREATMGWTFTVVDAEDEFWVQYENNPEQSQEDLLDRTKYQKAHDEIAAAGAKEYDLAVDAEISVHLHDILPDEHPNLNVDDIKVSYLATIPSNWSTDSNGKSCLRYPLAGDVDDSEKICYSLDTIPSIPKWAPSYPEIRAEKEEVLEQLHSLDYAEEQAVSLEAYAAGQLTELERVRAKATEAGVSVRDVVYEEIRDGRKSGEPDPPEFAIFLHGYGQSSPLYSVMKKCQDAGRGVTYNARKGLCDFSESYCTRYGLDFFYNEDLGVFDCELSRGQAASEFLFETTITRSTKRGFQALGSARPVPRVGSCHRAVGCGILCGGVQAKHVENSETYNCVEPSTAFAAIEALGLSGFA